MQCCLHFKKKVISGLVFSSLRTQEINSSICGLRMINIHENFKNSISLPTFVENMTGYGFLTMYIYLKYGTCCCLLPWINNVVVASVEFFFTPNLYIQFPHHTKKPNALKVSKRCIGFGRFYIHGYVLLCHYLHVSWIWFSFHYCIYILNLILTLISLQRKLSSIRPS